MWKIFLRDAVQRWHEREIAEKIGVVNGAVCNRVCFDVPRHVMSLSAIDEKGKTALATVVCNGLWTKVDAISAGYKMTDNLCGMCGRHPDTLHDRLWNCQHPEVV